MRERPAIVERLKAAAARVRPPHLAALAVLVVGGLVLMTMRSVALPGPAPVLDGDRLHIEVVAPVEPEIAPGSVMEVGELVDGFEYTPPPRRAPEPAAYAPYDDGYEAPAPRAARTRSDEDVEIRTPPQPEPPRDDWRDSRAARWFGFDAPDRDYRAEREERRARREAMAQEREREERSVRWYRSDGQPVDERDAYRRDDRRPPWREDRREREQAPYDDRY